MKKIINGKIYNTETAVSIASWENGLSSNDFRSCEETLYKTKKGVYFMHGNGGPMSRWSVSNGDTTSGGESIVVLSEAESIAWCEEHDIDADIISANFAIEEG